MLLDKVARKLGKEEENGIKKKIHTIIDKNYGDIKHDIKFIPNWSEETNCECFQEGIYSNALGLTRCWKDRLESCVREEKEMSPIDIIKYLMKK